MSTMQIGFIVLIGFVALLGGLGFMVYRQLKKTDPKQQDTSLKKDITTAQEFLPFVDINHNMIDLGNHQYRAVIEVPSLNYNLRTSKEKEMIELSYQRFLNSLSFPTMIYIQTRTLDTSKMIRLLKEDIDQTLEDFKQDPKLKEYGDVYLQEMETLPLRLQNTKQKKKYIIIPYDEAGKLTTIDNEEKYAYSAKEIFTRQQIVIEGLRQLELQAKLLDTYDIWELISSVYHRTNNQQIEGVLDESFMKTIVGGRNMLGEASGEQLFDALLVDTMNKIKEQSRNVENPNLKNDMEEAYKEIKRIREELAGYHKG